MIVQNKPGIYVYFTYTVSVSIFLKPKRKIGFEYFATLEDFFKSNSEYSIRVGFSTPDRIYYHPKAKYATTNSYRAVFDQDGNFFTVDRLIGLYRKWLKQRYAAFRVKRNGYNKAAYGKYHLPKIFNECRDTFVDPDAVELDIAVKGRTRWNSAYGYDDYGYTHNDKSWKTQSKREHQYR